MKYSLVPVEIEGQLKEVTQSLQQVELKVHRTLCRRSWLNIQGTSGKSLVIERREGSCTLDLKMYTGSHLYMAQK